MKPLWALVLSVFQFIPLIEPRTYHTRDAITVEGNLILVHFLIAVRGLLIQTVSWFVKHVSNDT